MAEKLVTRRIVAGAAWTVPVILVGQPAAAESCSPSHVVTFVPDTGITSATATKPVNGHTLGTFTWKVCNKGTTTIPANTTFTATFTAEKAPGSKGMTVTPQVTSAFSVTPATTRTLNPDGPPKGEATVTVTLSLNAALAPGACATQVWDVDSETGVGATQLRLTVALTSYGNGTCGATGTGGNTSSSAVWGAGA